MTLPTNEIWTGDAVLATVTADAPRGSFALVIDGPDFAGGLDARLDSYGTTDVAPANPHTAQRRLCAGYHA
ncbi:MAG TPA: hypothetical protein VFR67_09005 [Pilimelia sp.]|nr:hypothetical protein [Pilimelia sp.]